ncbi:MAG: NAD(P)-binding protein, partial [Sediminibacterium sp.]|nr:NAD(P)-binding protein [Sediminibacterium sp.]
MGGGAAGATAAYCLTKNSKLSLTLIEKSNRIGGMAASFELFNQIVDIGPHRFFSTDRRVNTLWLEVVEKDYKMVNRTTRILYQKKFFDYPLKPFDALIKLGVFKTIQCIGSYLYYKIFPHKANHTFEGWVTNRFGKKLYKTFFKSYTEKLWGIPCTELNAEFAQQRIKKFSLGAAIISAFKLNNNKHKTLVDQFAYPIKGTGSVYEKMMNIAQSKGLNYKPNCTIKTIEKINTYWQITFSNGEIERYENIISSMPITDLLQILPAVPQHILNATKQLKFRNTIIGYVHIKQTNLFKDQWLYIQEENIKTGRITNFNNWVKDILFENHTGTILALEYWCYETDNIWQYTETQLQKIAIEDLLKCGFIKNETDVLAFKKIQIPKCYPVYDNNYKPYLDEIISYLKTIENLQLIGRYGSFKYNNQDHSILMGYLAAENIINNSNHNLWDINTDYEYQESSKITETGLV